MGMLLSLSACGEAFTQGEAAEESKPAYLPAEKIEGSSLYVKKVENLPEDFILGMDISSVIAQENSGVRYYDFDGNEKDLLQILAENGVNYIRVRVWNDPYDDEGHGFGGGNCDIDTAAEIGKRATRYGQKLLVDFHYSDFWADPSKQMCPRAWEGMEIEEKTEAAFEYTRDCLNRLKDAGVDVGMVQIGNETNGALAGEDIWFNIQYLMQAGARATREVYPEALVALHFANPEKITNYYTYAKKLDYYDVDYDVFATSYYPFWHGTLENLTTLMTDIGETYGKKVMVAETSYAYTPEDTDFNGNTIGDGGTIVKNYPFTVQGQANCFRDVVQATADMDGGIGVFYWEGAWITVGTESWEKNHATWEEFGSGWASSYAGNYDPNDAGKYYGGSAVDNQAMFGPDGHPLESLRVFNLVRYGNETELRADAVQDSELTVDLNGKIELPETVMAVMSDDSRREIPVVWDVTESDLEKMYAGGAAKYDIVGTAGGMEAHCRISMIEFNFLDNYSFEAGDLGPWTVTEAGHADELYVEKKPTDSLTGQWHMHFWSAEKDSVEFNIEQSKTDLRTGKYKFTVSIMGGDCGSTDIYAYVKVNGEIAGTAPMQITSYGSWDTVTVPGVAYTEGQTLTVGVYVKAEGSGNGAWGKIDDALLNSESG